MTQLHVLCALSEYSNTGPLSFIESVYIVGLKGELKSNRLQPHETTFSHDVDSIGENMQKNTGVDDDDG